MSHQLQTSESYRQVLNALKEGSSPNKNKFRLFQGRFLRSGTQNLFESLLPSDKQSPHTHPIWPKLPNDSFLDWRKDRGDKKQYPLSVTPLDATWSSLFWGSSLRPEADPTSTKTGCTNDQTRLISFQ